jgi:allantoate deiminase
MTVATPLIRAQRAVERLERLADVGRQDGRPGITRLGLGAEEQQACELVAEWMAEDGLAVSFDSVGNLYGQAPGRGMQAGAVWSGSHLDTVPDGGAFDGALGVLVALEAVAALAAERLPAPLNAVAFRDEEGCRFGGGCFGSRAVCRRLGPGDLTAADAAGTSAADALAALGYPGPPVATALPAAFVEVHIEQGPVLERWGIPHAAVTAINGIAGGSITFRGTSGHAGTVPMAERQDAFMAAAEFGLRLRQSALRLPGAIVTLGEVRVTDAAPNRVPGEVRVSVDLRAPEPEVCAELLEAAAGVAESAAERHACDVDVEWTWHSPPVELSPRVRELIHRSASQAEIPLIDLPSGAGHDAGVLAEAGVEAGMVFVRSLNGGVSHRPDELSSCEDIASAITVLEGTLRMLAGGG